MVASADGELTGRAYERLCRAAETYREELVVELGGEVGLRPGEMTSIRPADLTGHEYAGETHYFLSVPDDGRRAYVPADVAHDLRKYVTTQGISDDEPIFDVTPRRLQMLIADVAERAGDRRHGSGSGDAGLSTVSARDLRNYFARRHLVEDGVDPRIVQAIGGWKSLESLSPYLDDPTEEEIAAALSDGDDATATRSTRWSPRRRPPRREAFAEYGRQLGDALGDASTREAVEQTACETLTDVYPAAWICDEHGNPRTWIGFGEGVATKAVESAVRRTNLLDERGVRGDATGVVQRPLDVPAWDGHRELAIVPLRSNDTVHGLLCVADASGYSHEARRFLTDVGGRIGWAIAAVERKRLLLADTSIELTFEITDDDSFFVAASRELGCQFDLDGIVPVEGKSLLYFVTVRGTSVAALLDRAADVNVVSDVRLLRDHGESAQLEFVVSGPSPATTLVEHGGTIEECAVEDGVATLTGVFSNQVNVRAIIEDLVVAFPGSELLAKRKTERPVRREASVRRAMEDRLTDKQRSVLRAAYLAGYFEWPRGSTAEELADSMDVSAPTLHNHLRKAQQKVFTAVFEEPPAADSPRRG